MPYWKFGGGYSYRTPRSKKTGWSKTLAGVPASAKKASSTSSTKKKRKTSSPSKKSTKRRRKNIAPKKKSRSRSGGMRLPGGIGPKGILAGIGAMLIVPRLVPVVTPGQTKLAAGLGLRALKIGGGGPLAAVGIMETAAEFLLPKVGGFIPGANGGGSNSGVYDY